VWRPKILFSCVFIVGTPMVIDGFDVFLFVRRQLDDGWFPGRGRKVFD